ncbi:YbhB/YbcL family Raf kinase inhibitor-like protein [Chloroflexota bacterium]
MFKTFKGTRSLTKMLVIAVIISLMFLPLTACGGKEQESESTMLQTEESAAPAMGESAEPEIEEVTESETEESTEPEPEEEIEPEPEDTEPEAEDTEPEPEESDEPEPEPTEPEPEPEEIVLEITSPAFADGDDIPFKYSCDGQDKSPELAWSGVSEGTQSFALILDDPDAPGGTFTHWLIFNIPADSLGLPEALSKYSQLDNGATQCRNDFGTYGYGGPCPPAGAAHHYHFKLYALDQTLDLSAASTKAQLLNAIEGHILAQAELVSLYQY